MIFIKIYLAVILSPNVYTHIVHALKLSCLGQKRWRISILRIKEFFFNRSFKDTLNYTSYKEYNVTSSVYQGLKLAHFCVAKVKMYVDDLTIYTTITSNEDKNKFQNELNESVNWANIING